MQIVERVLQVLEALSATSEGAGVSTLSERLGVPGSSVHRILTDLTKHGYTQQDPGTRRYRLGPEVLRLSLAYERQTSLVQISRPHMHALRDRTAESVFLTELVSEQAICVAMAESPRPLQFFIRLGQHMPFHSAASARAILAYQSQAIAERLVSCELAEGGRYPSTALTPTTVAAVLEELDRIREAEFALCDEEMEVGVTAISSPIRDAGGSVRASLTVVGPSTRLDALDRQRTIKLVQEAATAISGDLGYREPHLNGQVAGLARTP